MCGIAGVYERYPIEPEPSLLAAMLHVERHRGPESAGLYLGEHIGLGHDRLSIIDLTGGLQPICNEDGTLWIICNGEVFNYVELREELQTRGHRFRTGSDTEVILHLYEESGPECLQRLNGQYAIALWDARKRLLLLARDRLGIRPLFYTQVGDTLLFASEIKALFADSRVPVQIDPEVLDQIFTYWAPLPGRTAFRGIYELPPAHYMLIPGPESPSPPHTLGTLHRYWALDFSGEGQDYHSEGWYAEQLLELLVDATRLRLRADVPVGAYLSGGLDSSAIAAVVKRYTSNSLRTFSIAFKDSHFDERAYQERMAHHLGTEHTSMECTDSDIALVFEDVVRHVEAPILRTAPAPMYMLSELVARNNLKVVLTGEGSDEFLGGYDIFKEAMLRRFWAVDPQSKVRPLLLKKLYGDVKGMSATSQPFLEAFFRNGLTETDNPAYSHLVRWRNTTRIKRMFSADLRGAINGSGDEALLQALEGIKGEWHALSKAQFVESRTFLSQYLLSSQGDRVSMAHAVEGRFPFLDYRLVEFAARIPPSLRLKGFNEKYILKRAVADLLPREVLARTKRPYRAPIRNAFLGEVTPPYVGEALSEDAVRLAGIFDPRSVALLVRKCREAQEISEADSMALVGVLSTQLLHKFFVQERSHWCEKPEDFNPVLVGSEPIMSHEL
ncbi:MAG: asparagine synthase (glutamine-hydrolyzing) [Chloroflexia bacterium]